MNDKQQHFLGGFALALVVAIFTHLVGLSLGYACWLGATAAGVAGAWKEWVYDAARTQEHTVDRVDFLATTAGGVAGSIVFMVAKGFL